MMATFDINKNPVDLGELYFASPEWSMEMCSCEMLSILRPQTPKGVQYHQK